MRSPYDLSVVIRGKNRCEVDMLRAHVQQQQNEINLLKKQIASILPQVDVMYRMLHDDGK